MKNSKPQQPEHIETKLQTLYAERKASVQAPNEIKQRALNTAAKQSRNPWRWLSWQSAALMFAIVIVYGQFKQNQNQTYLVKYRVVSDVTKDNQVVYRHNINGDKNSALAKRPASAYQSYLDSLAKLSDRKTLHGVIKQNNDSMTIEVCELGLISISEQILTELNIDLGKPQFKNGNGIVLYANQQGFITGIDPDQQARQCKHLNS